MIRLEDRDGVAVLQIDHGKVNAIDVELLGSISSELTRLQKEAPRAVVLTGTGDNFSAGLDLLRVIDEGPDYLRSLLPRLNRALQHLFTFPRPVLAAINGHAIAGGFILACACDHRIMVEGSGKLGVTELPVGVPFPFTALEMVRTVAGDRRTRQLVFGGRLFSAAEGEALGLVDALVEPGRLVERTLEVAERWGSMPPAAFELSKRQLQQPTLHRLTGDGPAHDAAVAEIWGDPATIEAIRRFVGRTFKK